MSNSAELWKNAVRVFRRCLNSFDKIRIFGETYGYSSTNFGRILLRFLSREIRKRTNIHTAFFFITTEPTLQRLQKNSHLLQQLMLLHGLELRDRSGLLNVTRESTLKPWTR